MSRVLLLNSDYEPLNICTLHRAIKLIIVNKADVLHYSGDTFVSGGGLSFEIPSVIRLNYKAKRKFRSEFKVSRYGIYARDNFSCQYCGQKHIDLTLDHIYPKHLGGVTSWQNLVTSCKKCNYKKAGKTLEKSGMNLLSNPKVPRYSFSTILSKHKDSIDENWKYYITI
jgi:5-methylcytosine-specific restriction endonuclease McrA